MMNDNLGESINMHCINMHASDSLDNGKYCRYCRDWREKNGCTNFLTTVNQLLQNGSCCCKKGDV